MTQFLSERLRKEGREINAFGGYDELQQLLDEAALRLEDLEYKRLQSNVLLVQLRDMTRDVGTTLTKTADLLSNAIEVVL
jgi:hypothetical protein